MNSCSCPWHRRVAWGLQLLAALILGQTLFFKFTAAPESVYIFTQLGAEPWGRVASGVVELVAVGLLLVPRTAVLGGLLGAAVMAGAVASHLTRLGLVVQDDGGAALQPRAGDVGLLRAGGLAAAGGAAVDWSPVGRIMSRMDKRRFHAADSVRLCAGRRPSQRRFVMALHECTCFFPWNPRGRVGRALW